MRTAQAIAVVLLLLARTVGASDPIPWSDAGNHAGETVTVEGDVAAASSTPDQLVLEFAPGDASAFRVVLIIPIMTDLPRFPERLYQGKRIRASGVVRRFRGRPEMVLRSPGQIEIVDVAGPASAPPVAAAPPTTPAPRAAAPVAPPSPAPTAPVVPVPPSAAPAVPPATVTVPIVPTTTIPPAIIPPPVAATPPTTVPAPPPAPRAEPPTSTLAVPTTTVPPPPSPLEALAELRCTRARERWQEAARRAGGLAADLQRCLAAGSYQCRSAAAAMAPALSELEWAEQQVADACP
jgi:hypothetical protein